MFAEKDLEGQVAMFNKVQLGTSKSATGRRLSKKGGAVQQTIMA